MSEIGSLFDILLRKHQTYFCVNPEGCLHSKTMPDYCLHKCCLSEPNMDSTKTLFFSLLSESQLNCKYIKERPCICME